jgi:mRNA turnover protein 4
VIPHGELTTKYGVEGGEDDPLPMAIEPTLRKLGVPTRLVRGKVVLEDGGEEGFGIESDGDVVCRDGDTLDSRQTTLLKIFGVRMAEFRVQLRAAFDKEGGTVKEIGEMEVDA